MWRLVCGSSWLQTLNCSSLLIPNKPIFAGEISGNIFISGQYFSACMGTRGDPEGFRASEQTGAVTTVEPIVTHCLLSDLGVWRFIFLLDARSCPLCIWSSLAFIQELFKRFCVSGKGLFLYLGTHLALWSDFKIRLFQPKLAENTFSPFLPEQGLLHWNCASFSAFGLFL